MSPAPIIAIGFLENGRMENADDWGAAIGWFLMDAAYSAYRELAIIPPYLYRSDGYSDIDNGNSGRREQLSRVAARSGARFGLIGVVSVQNDQFDLIIELIEYASNRRRIMEQRKGEIADLAITVHDLAQQFFSEAVRIANPERALLSSMLAFPDAGELRALAVAIGRARSLIGAEQHAVYEDLWRERAHLGSVALMYLTNLAYNGKADDVRTKLPGILAANPNSIALKTYGNRLQVQYSFNGIDLAAQENLKRLLRENPNNLGAWMALSDSYLEERIHYEIDVKGNSYTLAVSPIDHHIGYASAVALWLELANRWPGYYRTWWGLSYSLQQYAWLVRGTYFWREVPEDNRNRYRQLMALADEFSDKAIQSHPAQSDLYANRIVIDMAMGRDWKPSFYRASELNPRYERPYRTAFCYARPQWGGTEEDRREVYRIAKKNNPDADWPRRLRDSYATDIKPLIDFDHPWTRRGFAIAFVALLCLLWRYWRQSRSI